MAELKHVVTLGELIMCYLNQIWIDFNDIVLLFSCNFGLWDYKLIVKFINAIVFIKGQPEQVELVKHMCEELKHFYYIFSKILY